MQHKSTIALAKAAIRGTICSKCYQRPPGSETHDVLQPRLCEPACTIFVSLPRLLDHVEAETNASSPDEAIRTFICPTCAASPSAGEYCPNHLFRTCPLSRYSADILRILEDLHRLRARRSGNSPRLVAR